MLHYNKTRLTIRCVQSILDAGYSPQQIYCFDNGSKPEFFLELKKKFPHIFHLRINKNCGYSGGFNRALNWVFLSGSSSALFCTNDTVVYPGALESCKRTAEKTGAGMVAPRIIYLSHPDSIDSIGAYFNSAKCSIHHYHELNMPEILCEKNDYIPGTALWINRQTFEELNGTDEEYFMYWEDVDMCFRAHKKRIPLARCYESRIGHGVGQTCHKKPLYTTFYFQRNRIRFCKRFLEGEKLDQAMQLIKGELLEIESRCQKKGDTKRLAYLSQLLNEVLF